MRYSRMFKLSPLNSLQFIPFINLLIGISKIVLGWETVCQERKISLLNKFRKTTKILHNLQLTIKPSDNNF